MNTIMTELDRIKSDDVKIICFHPRYNIGDTHDFDEPFYFLEDLAIESLGLDGILSYAANSTETKFKIAYDETCDQTEMKAYLGGQYVGSRSCTYDGTIDECKPFIVEDILSTIPQGEIIKMIKTKNCILPVYLYDHSGITINTVPYSCRWDSGQIGWIYQPKSDTATETEMETELSNIIKDYDAMINGDYDDETEW